MYEITKDSEAEEWIDRVWDSYCARSPNSPTFWQAMRATIAIILDNYNPSIGNPWYLSNTTYLEGTVVAYKSLGKNMTSRGESESFMELRIHGFSYNILEDSTL